jgi:hypothetical protein
MGAVSTDPRSTGPPSKPPRSALTGHHMLTALGVLVIVVLAIGGLSRSCAFAPTGPMVDTSRLPVVDAPAELRRLAPGVTFPVRVPAAPADWRSNSTAVDVVPDGGGHAVRTGYLTPQGRYLRLLQSDATEDALLAAETGPNAVPAVGVVEVGTQRWVAYGGSGERAEPIWITEVAAPGAATVRMLVTGSGTEDDYRTLATAAAAGELLPTARTPG